MVNNFNYKMATKQTKHIDVKFKDINETKHTGCLLSKNDGSEIIYQQTV